MNPLLIEVRLMKKLHNQSLKTHIKLPLVHLQR